MMLPMLRTLSRKLVAALMISFLIKMRCWLVPVRCEDCHARLLALAHPNTVPLFCLVMGLFGSKAEVIFRMATSISDFYWVFWQHRILLVITVKKRGALDRQN
jgi:hypothetical protein